MGFREYYQIWFKRVESKNNISQFAFKIHRNQTSATFPQTQKEIIIINEKTWQLAKEYIIKINTIFVRYRQGSDGAAQVGDECTHGSIVEFEKLGLQILIGHRVFFQFEN